MKPSDLKSSYKTLMADNFPQTMEITFSGPHGKQSLTFEKAAWRIDGIEKGLRYGENPGQEAALYRLVNGNLYLGEVTSIKPGRYLASDVELLQSGKHPGKTNITDVDNALNILRYFQDIPCTVIVKHNNPCGVAKGSSLSESYYRANMADRIAAFGGAITLNREVDKETAELICQQYSEVVAAPEYAEGVLDIFAKKRNLRIMRIADIERLQSFIGERVVDFKSLMDGGVIVQWSYVPQTLKQEDLITASALYKGKEYRIKRLPTDREYEDLIFGWLVESGITSNSVIYVKNGVTVGIGTGEQDRVGVAEIARDKAYKKTADRIAFRDYQQPYSRITDPSLLAGIDELIKKERGGLKGSCMISDAFFPFKDGVEVGIKEGVSAVIQPGGSERDFESIEACNEAGVAMVFTGQRSFKH